MKDYELPAAGYEHFGTADDGGGYDWSQFDVWLKDGVFYWADDCGCSCTGPYEDDEFEGPDSFEGHGNAHDAIKALHSWVEGPYGGPASDSLLVKLLDYKPKDTK